MDNIQLTFDYTRMDYRLQPENGFKFGTSMTAYCDDAGRDKALAHIMEVGGTIETETQYTDQSRFTEHSGEWGIRNNVFFCGENMRKVRSTITSWRETSTTYHWVSCEQEERIILEETRKDNQHYDDTHPVWM